MVQLNLEQRLLCWLAALACVLALGLLWMGAVQAQTIAVSLDVQPRTFTTPTPLTVTWTAQAPATACTASGGWSGAKAISGSEQVAGVVGSTTFNLSCSGATGPVTVSWVNPTQNTDGSAYSDPKHTEVYRASSAAGLPNATGIAVAHPATSFLFSGLPSGTHHFATKAVNTAGTKSDLSASASSSIQPTSGSATPVTVTGSTAPEPPTGVVATGTVAYAVRPYETELKYVLDGQVGRVTLGIPCIDVRPMADTGYYAVSKSYVTWTSTRRPKTVVAKCGAPP